MGEQRRSQRFPCEVAVVLREGKLKHDLITRDVSRHGLFVRTTVDLTERNLVQLQLGLPDGPLPATAFVARNAQTQDLQGAGLQFFALSAQSKQRWDDFVNNLNGQSGATRSQSSDSAPDTATFLVKLKDEARLLEFLDANIVPGAIYLATPVLKEEGASVDLVLIHPTTEQEFTITGKVRRVRALAPKGMDIRLNPTPALIEAFQMFVQTGVAPKPEVLNPPAGRPTTDDISVDIVVDEDALEESARFEWNEVTDFSQILDLGLGDSDSIDLIIEEAITGDLTNDVVVDQRTEPPTEPGLKAESPLGPPPQTGPIEVVGSGDLYADEGVSVDLEPVRDAVFIPEEIASADLEIPPEADRTGDLVESQVLLRLHCDACDARLGACTVGGVRPPLGLLAELKPFWSPELQKVCSVPRLKNKEQRRLAKEALGNNLLDPISLETLFEVAELASPPLEPSTGGKLRVNRLVRELRDKPIQTGKAEAKCPICSERQVFVSAD